MFLCEAEKACSHQPASHWGTTLSGPVRGTGDRRAGTRVDCWLSALWQDHHQAKWEEKKTANERKLISACQAEQVGAWRTGCSTSVIFSVCVIILRFNPPPHDKPQHSRYVDHIPNMHIKLSRATACSLLFKKHQREGKVFKNQV